MRGDLYLVGALVVARGDVVMVRGNSGDVIDCGDYVPYTSSVQGNPPAGRGFKVHLNGVGYSASTWIGPNDVPGSVPDGAWSPWSVDGSCRPGTDSDNADSGLPEIDCAGYKPWTKEHPAIGNPEVGGKMKVYLPKEEGYKAYESATYVDEKNVPGVDNGQYNPWVNVGKCAPGTMGDGLKEVDCTGIYAWSPYYSFTGGNGQQVTDLGAVPGAEPRLWNVKFWTQGELPSEGAASAYELVGKCKQGTATLGPEKQVDTPPQWKMDLTCTCCEKCGSVQDGQVVCLDDKTKDNCYYQWCGDSGKKDEQQCQYNKDHQVFATWTGTLPRGQKEWPKQVYAPYFDSGLAQYPPLTEIMDKFGVNHFVIAFIVSTSLPQLQTGRCQGAYAGAISVDSGPISYFENVGSKYLYDELVRVREKGGDFVVSFGGANGTELADAPECQQGDAVDNLFKEYGRVLDILNTDRIDFDIEGAAYAKNNAETGWTYRFNAVKKLKEARPDLHVTWTLPILPTGLTPDDGVAFIDKMFELDAPFNVINVMNMDYGDCSMICKNEEIDKCERDAMDNLVQQLFAVAQKYNKTAQLGWQSPEDVWPFVGSTPMLGKNDVTCLTYTLDAAKTNLQYWQQKKLGMLSNWSLHRDMPCPSSQSVSVDCSSYDGQVTPHQFASIFSQYGKTN